ncbi:hypothetical protein LZ31DRAFT_548870 [Colletotrichum somersetense]|nr:hypothetical protein LZ31DRAFT_548870 [Colletotrichum somersetense]
MTVRHDQSWVFKLVNRLPIFKKRHEMAESEFQPNNVIYHRYARKEILQEKLLEMGFKKEDIKLKSTKEKGFEMQLPRKLEPGEKSSILKAFGDAEMKRRIESL